jgi:hypothetical protein
MHLGLALGQMRALPHLSEGTAVMADRPQLTTGAGNWDLNKSWKPS